MIRFLKRSKERPGPNFASVLEKCPPQGRFRRYDFCLRLSCSTSARHDPRHPWDTYVNVVSENCARVDGRKWWRMLVAHDSRRQQSSPSKSAFKHSRLKRVKKVRNKHVCVSVLTRCNTIYANYDSAVFLFCKGGNYMRPGRTQTFSG